MGWPYNTTHSFMWGSAIQVTGVGTASATVSSALPAGTNLVRVVADGAIWYNPVASASATRGAYLPANTIEFVAISSNAIISFMAVTTNGRTVWVMPCNA
jgi:hypothetical protein